MRHLVAVIVASCFAINPALANEFAACGVEKSKHPTVECYAIKVPYEDAILGRPNGANVEIFMMGPECANFKFSVEYNGMGLRQTKKIGTLACDKKRKQMLFNGKPIANYGGYLIN